VGETRSDSDTRALCQAIYLQIICLICIRDAIFVTIIGFVLMVAGFALSIIKQYSYSMTTYVLYDAVQNGTYEGPRSVINKSTELMAGNKWRLFCLQFSFIGWYILTALTCGLLYFYTLPYTTTAELFFYEDLIAKTE
jgi:uncharacterized membrane protein